MNASLRETTVLITKELCRVTFDDSEFYRLNIQIYSDSEPCYSVEKVSGHLSKTPANTTSTCLQEIISHYYMCANDTKHQANNMPVELQKVKDIYLMVAEKYLEFAAMMEAINNN